MGKGSQEADGAEGRELRKVLIHNGWKEGQRRANYELKTVAWDCESKAKKV